MADESKEWKKINADKQCQSESARYKRSSRDPADRCSYKFVQ